MMMMMSSMVDGKAFAQITGKSRDCFTSYLVNSTPKLKDLYERITPYYASDWRVIGTLLGLPSGELKAIEAGYPTNVKWCCNQMLEKWLETDTTASWNKLYSVIQSPAVSYSAPDNAGE